MRDGRFSLDRQVVGSIQRNVSPGVCWPACSPGRVSDSINWLGQRNLANRMGIHVT